MHAHELLLSPIAYMAPPRLLDGLSAGLSEARVAGFSHSVVEIVAHLNFWQGWFLKRCAGEAIPPPASASLGWPAASGSDWDSLRQRFVGDLERAVQLGGDIRRVEPPIEFPPLADYTLGDAVTHIAIHNAHHLGQIVVLRQILGAWPPPEGSYTW